MMIVESALRRSKNLKDKSNEELCWTSILVDFSAAC